MRSPSFNEPLTSTTSTVVPKPSKVFTSSTVACVSSSSVSRSAIMLCVSLTISCRRSGMPSPVMALVGTTLTYLRGSLFFQYSATFKPCSLSCRKTCAQRSSNSRATCSFWRLNALRTAASGADFQSYRRSILFLFFFCLWVGFFRRQIEPPQKASPNNNKTAAHEHENKQHPNKHKPC